MNELWVEKYRPKLFEEVIGLGNSNADFLKKELPHLLLVGKPGTGKTSLAKVIIRQHKSDCLVLNASDERGIDVIRDKVKWFAMSQSTNNAPRIVFLDEGDSLTGEAQTCLRNTIETYSRNCRFIITANYVNKIIEPLKSRCMLIEFSVPAREEIEKRLVAICANEGVDYTVEGLKRLIVIKYPDIRSMINALQEIKIKGIKLAIETVERLRKDGAKQVYAVLKQGRFLEARQAYLVGGILEEQLIKELYEEMMKDELQPKAKANFILCLADCLKWLPQVAIKQILMEECFLKIIRGEKNA